MITVNKLPFVLWLYVRFAVNAARNYIKDFQELLDNPLHNLRLEEVELTEDEKHWLITLGY